MDADSVHSFLGVNVFFDLRILFADEFRPFSNSSSSRFDAQFEQSHSSVLDALPCMTAVSSSSAFASTLFDSFSFAIVEFRPLSFAQILRSAIFLFSSFDDLIVRFGDDTMLEFGWLFALLFDLSKTEIRESKMLFVRSSQIAGRSLGTRYLLPCLASTTCAQFLFVSFGSFLHLFTKSTHALQISPGWENNSFV